MNRRDFVKAGIVPLAMGLPGAAKTASAISAAEPAEQTSAQLYSEAMPDMLVTYMTNKLNAWAAKWDQKRAAIHTPEQLEARNRFVREKCAQMIHGISKGGPLNAVTVKTLKRDGYNVECLMYESQPDFWVTASLYVPTTGSGPFPAIISPCGHYELGRMYPDYQCAYFNLVKNGFVVLAPDPVGEGERRQFWNPMTNTNDIGGPTTWEHSLPGQLLLLIGDDITHYRIWDLMRGIDYLLSRPEVDHNKIGCAGHSGGGTMTYFLSSIDTRIKCAVVNEGGTTNGWPVHIPKYKPMGTGDTDQHMFPSAIYGIDTIDRYVAIAPRPLLVTIEHMSKPFEDAIEKIRARYRVFGAADKLSTIAADDPHAWTFKLRNANADWFSRWFYNRKGLGTEPPFTPEPPENLWCTANGSVRYSRNGQTIYSRILRKQAELPPARKAPANSSELESYRSQIAGDMRKVIRYSQPQQSPEPREVTTTPRKGYKIEKLEFLSEPGIYIPTWVYHPNSGLKSRTAVLYVSDGSRVQDGMEFGLLENLTLKGHTIFAVDVRGIGATMPNHVGDEHGEFGQVDNADCDLAYMAWNIDEDLFGMRVLDVIRSLDYVLSRPDVDSGGVVAIGRGIGALWTLYAAALDQRIKSLVTDGGLLSYRALAEVDRYKTESSTFVRDVLTHFDLPDIAAAVADRPLTILSPRDPMNQQVDLGRARREYARTETIYRNVNASGRFRVERGAGTSEAEQYLKALGMS